MHYMPCEHLHNARTWMKISGS